MKAKIHSRTHSGGTTVILAICDTKLLGKKFEGKGIVLDLKKYKSFYDGEKINEEKAVSLIKEYKNLNLVGEKAIKAAKKALKLTKTNVKRIKGVPHLQVYYM
ncbi:MAG: DUF424 family protein [Candidatus Micrarchaeota archaeon]